MGWDTLSRWYDRKQGEQGDLWHRALIDPPLLRLIGDCKDKKILDLGCGNGYLSRKYAREGAKVTAVDFSPKMIEYAKSHDLENTLRINYLHANANNLLALNKGSFDLVFANMSLMNIEDAEGAVGEVARVLKRGGKFVASICHPCFDNGPESSWLMEKISGEPPKYFRKIRAYRKQLEMSIRWKVDNDTYVSTISYHRPLNWYVKVLNSYGLVITNIEEPEPTSEFNFQEKDSPGFLEVPLHLVLETRNN